MTIQEEPATWKENSVKKKYPFEDPVDQILEIEEGSVVNRVGKRGFQ